MTSLLEYLRDDIQVLFESAFRNSSGSFRANNLEIQP